MLVNKKRVAVLYTTRSDFVVRPGFEPRQTVPKTVVLPLYYRTINFKTYVPKWNANVRSFLKPANISAKKNKKKFGLVDYQAYLVIFC